MAVANRCNLVLASAILGAQEFVCQIEACLNGLVIIADKVVDDFIGDP